MRFFSDNTATACPEILTAIERANHGRARAYGDDEWTQRLDAVLGEHFGTPAHVSGSVRTSASSRPECAG